MKDRNRFVEQSSGYRLHVGMAVYRSTKSCSSCNHIIEVIFSPNAADLRGVRHLPDLCGFRDLVIAAPMGNQSLTLASG